MPTSPIYQLNSIMDLIVHTNPKRMLDVGMGFGKYGFLSREYLELWDGREEYRDWKRRIDGIEAFKKYITPAHRFIYDHIYVGDAVDILPTLKMRYDLLLLIDVLEHFDRKNGLRLLEICRKRSKNIIIATPREIGTQKDSFGNPFETHKFQWREENFDKYEKKFFVPNDYSLICYIGADAVRLKKIFVETGIKSVMRKNFPFLKVPYRWLKNVSLMIRNNF